LEAIRRWDNDHPGIVRLCTVALGVLLCGVGLYWEQHVAPLMDDSDPSAAIGGGLLLFGVPASVLASVAVATMGVPRLLKRLGDGLVIAALAMEAIPIAGLIVYELMFSRTLWSR
jgi:hypothetical protein